MHFINNTHIRHALAGISGYLLLAVVPRADACCAVVAGGSHVVNADQTVILLWDEKSGMEHFIRKADFKTDAKDLGFLVPSPSRPRLEESGGAAFTKLAEITAPRNRGGIGFPIGCAVAPARMEPLSSVRVIEEKRVAGYDATVLTARSGSDLVAWLERNGYPYSPAVAEWAKPYLGGNWHFTALKIAKESERSDVKAASLRISFQTDRPLFPYREPDSGASKAALKVPDRLLRIYFISDARFRGTIDGGKPWSGRTVWSGDITHHRKALLEDLGLPADTGPPTWWLTEFEDRWPYARAAGDLYFQRDAGAKEVSPRQSASHRTGGDASICVMLAIGLLIPLRRAVRGSSPQRSRE
jgi:hypothetical protein